MQKNILWLSFVILLGVFLFASAGHASAATTYYVATTGTDNAGCGAVGSPCLTIEYTYEKAAVVAGDTILVQPGTYTGGGSHNTYGRARLAKQGTANAPITIRPSLVAVQFSMVGLI